MMKIQNLKNALLNNYTLPLLGGLFFALGFPTFLKIQFFPCSLFGMALLWTSLPLLNPTVNPSEKRSSTSPLSLPAALKTSLLSVLLFCLTDTLIGYYWIPFTVEEFGGIGAPFNYLIGSLYAFIIFPYLWIFVFLLYLWIGLKEKYLIPRLNQKKTRSSAHLLSLINPLMNHPSVGNFTWALILALLEQVIPQQFATHLGHPWLQMAPYLKLAPIFGLPLFSFMSYWGAFALFSFWSKRKIDRIFILSFALFLLCNIISPLEKIPHQSELAPAPQKLNIRIVQANIGNFLKVSSEEGDAQSLNHILALYEGLSVEKSASPVDLIIWPETAFPFTLFIPDYQKSAKQVPHLFKKIQALTGAEILFGGYQLGRPDSTSDFETTYNSAFFLDSTGKIQNTYNKHLLLHFGETLPFGSLNAHISPYIQNISYFLRGNQFSLFKTKTQIPFAVVLCYEVLFSSFIRDLFNHLPERPDFLINLTNDSWFGNTSEPYQHLFLAKWRAVEFAVPLIRSTNTGITSIIYPDGSESKRLEIFREGNLDSELSVGKNLPTPFQKRGLLNLIVLWPGLVVLVLIEIFLNSQLSSRKAFL